MMRREHVKTVNDIKVLPSGCVTEQHKVLIAKSRLHTEKTRKKMKLRNKLHWWGEKGRVLPQSKRQLLCFCEVRGGRRMFH